MVLHRIRRSLSNNEGSATPMILALILCALIIFAALFQYFYTTATLKTIREACSSVAESVLIANAEASYQAKRDGYTGIWHLEDGEVSDPTVYIDASESLARQLYLVSEGETLVKMNGDESIYRLRDIQITIHNPEFQDADSPLTATLSLVVDISLNFPLIDRYPISVPITVSAAWNPKF